MTTTTITVQVPTAVLSRRSRPKRREIRRASRLLVAEAERQGFSHPSLLTLITDSDARADLWYALDCPPFR